jgi:hypothetical protein
LQLFVVINIKCIVIILSLLCYFFIIVTSVSSSCLFDIGWVEFWYGFDFSLDIHAVSSWHLNIVNARFAISFQINCMRLPM